MASTSPSSPKVFHHGDEVEVRATKVGFVGGWYEARVDSRTPTGHYMVTYKFLADKTDASKHLQETVPSSDLRPRPPPEKQSQFVVGEPVDVRYMCGWWDGIVREFPAGHGAREYKVLVMKNQNIEVCLPEMMRRRVRWVDGAWVVQRPQGGKEWGARKRRTGHISDTSASKKRTIDMEGTSRVVDHQDSMPANKPSVEEHSTRSTTEPITQYQNDEAGRRNVAMFLTPNVDIEADLTTPVSNESHSKDSALPFKKTSLAWKYIDLELTPKLRQHPHFRPLEQFPEVQREGKAIGLMVTYELMSFHGVPKMDISCRNLDEYLSTTIELEANGFQVQNMRSHFEKLQRAKNNHTQLFQNKSAIEGQVFENKEECDHLDSELIASDRAVTALNQVLCLFHERKLSLLKQKEESETKNFSFHV